MDIKELIPADALPSGFIASDIGSIKIGMHDGARIILGHNGVKGGHRRFAIFCKDCAKDPELFGGAVFIVTPRTARLLKGCGCGRFTFSEQQNSLRVFRKCEKLGYQFSGWNGDYSESKINTKLKLTCDNGHNYNTTSIVKFLDCD